MKASRRCGRSADGAHDMEAARVEQRAIVEHQALDGSPVLVTGASGFVGSAIAAAVRAAGLRVRVLRAPVEFARSTSAPLDTVCDGDLTDRASLRARAERRALRLSRRRRLSPLGAQLRRFRSQQRRGHAPRHGGGVARRRRTDRLHEQRRNARGSRTARRRTRADRSPRTKRSAPTSAARSWRSASSKRWRGATGCRR